MSKWGRCLLHSLLDRMEEEDKDRPGTDGNLAREVYKAIREYVEELEGKAGVEPWRTHTS